MGIMEDAFSGPVVMAPGAMRGPGGEWPIGGAPVPSPRRVQDMGDAIISGIQNSATGLAVRGKTPSLVMGEDAPWYQRGASGLAGLVTDLPLSVAGAAVGAVVGSEVPVVGTAMGGMMGAFAAPMALREALMEAYGHNHAASWEGVWEIAKASLKGGAKGAVIGAATGGAGKIVAPLVEKSIASSVASGALTGTGAKLTIGAATGGAELTALTTTSAALEGKLPTMADFVDNAMLLGAGKAAVGIARNMMHVYGETGLTPDEIRAQAEARPDVAALLKDPKMMEKLLAGRGAGIPVDWQQMSLADRVTAAVHEDVRPGKALETLSKLTEPIDLSKPPIDQVVRTEYIVGEDSHKAVLRVITNLFDSDIEASRRGIVTNKETLAAAWEKIAGKMPDRLTGAAANASESAARLILLRDATTDAWSELQKLNELPITTDKLTQTLSQLKALAALERVANMKADADGLLAEWGRAGQMVGALKRDPSLMGNADALLSLVSKRMEGKGNIQDIARALSGFKDPSQLVRFAEEFNKATTLEKVLEAWKAGILSGPLTHLANIMGNAMKFIVDVPETAISATLTAAVRAAKGDPLTMAQYKARVLAPLNGWILGGTDGLKVAWEVMRQEGTHLEKADVYKTAIGGTFGTVVRIPFRLLQSMDALFRTPAERSEAYIMAVDRVVREGIHPETNEGRARIMELTNTPVLDLNEKQAKAATERIQQAGAVAVYAERLGPRMEGAQRVMAGSPIQFIIPFFRTPINLLSWATQHVPGINLMSSRWRADFMAGGERTTQAVARVMIGSAISLSAYSAASAGLLTGGGLFSKEESRTKMAAGWQPYSVKIGDKYYSYQRLEPVAKVLGLAADMIEMQGKIKDDTDSAKIASMIVMMFGNATISTTYLSGLANVVQSITDPGRYGQNFLEQYATSVVPKLIGQTTMMADPYKREVDGVIDAIQSQLPFIREKLLPKRDVWGEPVPGERLFNVLPIAETTISQDKVRSEAMRLQVAIADAPHYILEKAPLKPSEKRMEFTAEQRDVFKALSGRQAMSILTPIVNSPDWATIPDFAKAEVYKRVIEGTRKGAQWAVLPAESAERQQLRQKITTEILQQIQRAHGRVE